MTFYVTRHGKIIFNGVEKVQGISDTPLTKEGVDIATALGNGLSDIKFEEVYSSDSGRSRETAKLVVNQQDGKKLEINEDVNFREMNFGKYEGGPDTEMWAPAAKKLGFKNQQELMKNFDKEWLETVTDTMDAGDETGSFESYPAVRERFQKELKKIGEKASKSHHHNILIVSHGMAISSLLSNLAEENTDRNVPNASISKVTYKEGKLAVESIGDTSCSDQ